MKVTARSTSLSPDLQLYINGLVVLIEGAEAIERHGLSTILHKPTPTTLATMQYL